MRRIHFCLLCLATLLLLAVWNVVQAQDSLGMHHVASLDYWQAAYDMQIVGNLVYVVSGGTGLRIVDLTDPAHPQEIGRFIWYDWFDPVGGLYVTGNRAYVATVYGCCAIDVSDPTHPVQLARWWEDRSLCGIFVHDTIAIIEIERETLGFPVVADISDLGNVQQIGDFGGQHLWPVAMVGDYLFMVRFWSGLVVYDFSDPSQPVQVAQVDSAMAPCGAVIAGDYIYFGTTAHGVRIIDISNPLQPVEVDSFESGECGPFSVTGTHLVTYKYGYLKTWNIADPLHPVLEGVLNLTSSFSSGAAAGNLVCLGYHINSMAVAVVDISNYAAPVQVSSFGLIGYLDWLKFDGTTGYLSYASSPGARSPGICIMDLANPVNPSPLGTICGYGQDVAVHGNYAYVPSIYRGLIVFDISNPAEPESLYFIPSWDYKKIVTAGDYAYIIRLGEGLLHSSLLTFSLLDPVVPVQVDSLSMPYTSQGDAFGVWNGFLYIGAHSYSSSYLLVYGLENPEAPQLVGTGQLPNVYSSATWDIALADHYAYLAAYTGGLVTVDINQPENPVVVGQMLGDTISEVDAIGNIVVTDGNSRINMLDMSNPANPELVGYYPVLEAIEDIRVIGSYVFSVSRSELRVFQCDALTVTPSPPEVVPDEFELYPCYPNPFNPNTVIRFSLPYSTHAKLNIYDVTGRQVNVLADGVLNAGEHHITFDASDLSSGVYFCRLSVRTPTGQAGEFSQVQKMVLLK